MLIVVSQQDDYLVGLINECEDLMKRVNIDTGSSLPLFTINKTRKMNEMLHVSRPKFSLASR